MRTRLSLMALLVAVVCPLFAATACSDNKGDTRRPEPGTPNAQGYIQIEARDWSFVPDVVAAQIGTPIKIELHNVGSKMHSLTVYRDQDFSEPVPGASIPPLDSGGKQVVLFDSPAQPTILYFRCEVHPDLMHGELEVGDLHASKQNNE